MIGVIIILILAQILFTILGYSAISKEIRDHKKRAKAFAALISIIPLLTFAFGLFLDPLNISEEKIVGFFVLLISLEISGAISGVIVEMFENLRRSTRRMF
jgi:hypothetical protein